MKPHVWAAALCLAVATVAQAQAPADSRPLVTVIKDGDSAVALKMIAAGANVNAAQEDGTTPLQWAVYQVDTTLVQALLAHGARAEVTNHFGSSPLAEAVKVANPTLVAMLLKAGAKANSANADGQTPLMLAARTGSVAVAKQLVEHGAEVNAHEGWRGQSALMWAAGENRPDMVAYLISRGAKVSERAASNDWGNQITSEPRAQYRPTGGLTPLLYAVRSNCLACAQSILKAGADINLPTPDGVTPLMTAIDNLNFDVAKYLIEHGANPHVWDLWGRTALYIAVDMSAFSPRGGGGAPARATQTSALDLVHQLLAAGVNPNPQLLMHRPGRGGNSGRFTDDLLTIGATPLLRATISFDTAIMQALIEGGALVDLPNGMGVTPLMAAAGLGVSTRDTRGSYVAAGVQAKSIQSIELLLKAGADVNFKVADTSGHTARIARPSSMTDRQGQTALYGAINWGWADVVKYLLAHGARVDVADAAGKTPLDASAGNAGGRDHKNVDDIVAMIKNATKGGA